jgi:hypothetical protein
MSTRRSISILLGLLAVVVLCAVCTLATLAAKRLEGAKVEAAPTTTPQYNELGLPYGQELSTEPVEIQPDYLVFSDRILKRYHHMPADIVDTVDALDQFFAIIPAGVNKHLIMAPWYIAMEPDYAMYTDDIPAAIQQVYDGMAEDVHCLDVYAPLFSRRDEYLFARVDEAWTMRGAYYAAQEFLNTQGIEMIPIDDYEVYYNSSYIGSLEKDTELVMTEEDQLYYLLKGATNWQTVTTRVSSGLYETHESPAIALSRRQNIFLGSNISHSILHGDGGNGETLLIVGDVFGITFAPWFTPYYENVYFIRAETYNGTLEGFLNLFEEYNIQNCLVMEGITSVVKSTNNNLRRMAGGD